MARNRSMLGNPFVAGALTALGGYANRTSKDREDMRKFSQQQSIMNQKQLQKTANMSLESQLRQTEEQRMRDYRIANPTPSELATQDYREYQLKQAQDKEQNAADAMADNMLRAVVSAATTRVATDPLGALKMLKMHTRFTGNPDYDAIVLQVTEWAEIAKTEKKDNEELELFNAAMRNADSAKMTPADRIAFIGNNFENILEKFPQLVAPYLAPAEEDIARESERRAGRAQDAVDAREDKLHKGWGKEAATDAELKKYLEEARAQQGVFQDSLDVDAVRKKLEGQTDPVQIQREIGGLGEPRSAVPTVGGVETPPDLQTVANQYGITLREVEALDAQRQQTTPPKDLVEAIIEYKRDKIEKARAGVLRQNPHANAGLKAGTNAPMGAVMGDPLTFREDLKST